MEITRLDQFAITVRMHFPNVMPGNVGELSCMGCEDYKSKVCPGDGRNGEKVLECMWKHSEAGEWEDIGNGKGIKLNAYRDPRE